MNNQAVFAENISKRYRIGKTMTSDNGRRSLRRRLVSSFDYLRSTMREPDEEEILWALKDISFEVNRGDVMGIIGPNGAGKSTLLKILSRITEPTSGRVIIDGRIGSLLEVGTGFHPQLTGRENIYLSGAVLGMKRAEIDRRFDEIVAFSEVERFLDTQLKRYSSGMYVRLAFSVAAHLQPEVLIVDEVLAVGDLSFQKKCLGKMDNAAHEGRTVLFVSHNMIAIQNLCERVMWLDEGKIVRNGPVSEVVRDYVQSNSDSITFRGWEEIESAPGNEMVRIVGVDVRPVDKDTDNIITLDTPIVIRVDFGILLDDQNLSLTLQLATEDGAIAFVTNSIETEVSSKANPQAGLYRCLCYIPRNLLNSGTYRVHLLIVKELSSIVYRHNDILSFEVVEDAKERVAWFGKRAGATRPKLRWKTELIGEIDVSVRDSIID